MLHYDLHVPPTLYRMCCGAEGDEEAPRRVCDEKRQQYCRQRHSVRSAVALKGHSFLVQFNAYTISIVFAIYICSVAFCFVTPNSEV